MPFIDLAHLPVKEILPGFEGKFIHTNNLTIGYFEIKTGSRLPEHSHAQEQITHILEGKLEMNIAGELAIIEPGKVAVIPGNTPHSAVALTDCKALDIFYPARDDYK